MSKESAAVAPSSGAGKSPDEVQSWLKEKVAKAVGIRADDVDVTHEFAELGLDSRQSVRLSGELEKFVGKTLSPTLLMDCPTIASLVEFVTRG